MIGAVRRTALALPLAVALVASACSDGPPPDDTAGRDGGSGNSDVGVNTGGSGDPGAGVDPGVEPAPVVIAAGSEYICGLGSDGDVDCGFEKFMLPAPSGPFTAIAAGASHACGLRTDGTIKCWGDSAGAIATG